MNGVDRGAESRTGHRHSRSMNRKAEPTLFRATAELCDEHDVLEYRDMVTIIRDRVQSMIKKGMTLAQVKAAKPTLDYDGRYCATSGPWTTDMFVGMA